MLYSFDLFNERALFIECIGQVNEIVGREYPICTRSQGIPPKQVVVNGYSSSASAYNDDDLSDSELIDADDTELPDFEELEDMDDL